MVLIPNPYVCYIKLTVKKTIVKYPFFFLLNIFIVAILFVVAYLTNFELGYASADGHILGGYMVLGSFFIVHVLIYLYMSVRRPDKFSHFSFVRLATVTGFWIIVFAFIMQGNV
jgi:hypothetical protein